MILTRVVDAKHVGRTGHRGMGSRERPRPAGSAVPAAVTIPGVAVIWNEKKYVFTSLCIYICLVPWVN